MLLAGRTAAERRRRRAGLRLRDFSITTKTRQRYEYAVGKVLPFLEKHQKLGAIDEILCEYVEAQWARGESVNFIADTLSGLHFFWAGVERAFEGGPGDFSNNGVALKRPLGHHQSPLCW